MGIYVNTNVTALHAQRNLNNVTNKLTTIYQRLSSGMRINSAKDDAAGLQIADRLTAQINGLNQGNRNASDGIALAQTMEGAMDEISNMLQKMRTLAVQSATGTNTKEDREAINQEANQLAEEISRIATQTKYGGKTILAGKPANGDSSIFNEQINGDQTNGGRVKLQVGANQGDTITFSVASFVWENLVDKNGLTDPAGGGNAAFNTGWSIDLTSMSHSSLAITGLDTLIAAVDKNRASLGAIQNRLESSIRNQSNVAANQADARSRIRDADFAAESAMLAQYSIIQQAAVSMLMQANARPQLALSMLG